MRTTYDYGKYLTHETFDKNLLNLNKREMS